MRCLTGSHRVQHNDFDAVVMDTEDIENVENAENVEDTVDIVVDEVAGSGHLDHDCIPQASAKKNKLLFSENHLTPL